MKVFVALVHWPVYNRAGQEVATAITTLDIHDLARASRTYNAEGLLVINPLGRQQWLLKRILRHWTEGHGARVHPNRTVALEKVHVVNTLGEALEWVEGNYGRSAVTVATTAKRWHGAISYSQLREMIQQRDEPLLLLFGTGWGLSEEVIRGADFVLRPIMEGVPYNHLSVRSAASIILDRLLGDR